MVIGALRSVNRDVLSVGIGIPLFFFILIQLDYVLSKINPLLAVIINLETFTVSLLIFLAGIVVAVLLNAKIKEGMLNGALLGGIVALLMTLILTVFALISSSDFQINQIMNLDLGIYVLFNFIFQSIMGAAGGFLGSKIINLKK
jgi:hypothetical protein